MSLQVTNSLSRKKEPFLPIQPGLVTLYVCGPTVYNLIHVGNARPIVVFDVVRRYLEYSGFKVLHVSNITDVDDKIINKAKQENLLWSDITQRYIAEFNTDVESLKIHPPHQMPKVSDHIKEIVQLIENLIGQNSAYVAADGEVFFSVRSFKAYGKLSGKNIDDLLSGARVEVNDKKRDPLDFSLWKPQKTDDEVAWESPWGKGRPGWHIECSAMAMSALGHTFDIHGGGIDLLHPHHENEIAQAEAVTHKTFARYWLHNNLLTINAEKMSKSLGNIFLVRDFVAHYSAETLKFLLLSGHYRSPLDFSEKQVRESQAALHRVYSTLKKAEGVKISVPLNPPQNQKGELALKEFGQSFTANWEAAMDDDFNTAKVVGQVFEYVRAINAYFDPKGFKATETSVQISVDFLQNISAVSQVLNIFGEDPTRYLELMRELVLKEKKITRDEIETKIVERSEARKHKNFQKADEVRNELLSQGIELHDSTTGTDWDVIFSDG
jgi:cysteinyl-tRNA synthetase